MSTNTNIAISDLLKTASEFPDVSDRVDYLIKYRHPMLLNVLGYMFHPKVEWDLPEGTPPYNPSKFDEPARFYSEWRRMYLFVKGGHPTLKPWKREQLFIELLESISPQDAELLIAMKDKRSPYKGLTKSVAKKAFPEIFNDIVTE